MRHLLSKKAFTTFCKVSQQEEEEEEQQQQLFNF